MLSFPNAKINLGLHVLRKRDDGYHDIETCLVPIPYSDVLEILPAAKFSFTCSGLAVEGKQENNLCIKAYDLIKARYDIGPVAIHLHKVIPMGAGLGGGSSDAAFALKSLNEIFGLEIGMPELKLLAAQLGSDCPVFVDNKPALATGTGTNLENIAFDLSGKYLLLVFPEIGVSTQQAYSHVKPKLPELSIKNVLKQPVSTWKKLLFNDFENSLFVQYPELETLKNELYHQGAIYAAMSGSGSTIFGLFSQEPPQLFTGRSDITQRLIQL